MGAINQPQKVLQPQLVAQQSAQSYISDYPVSKAFSKTVGAKAGGKLETNEYLDATIIENAQRKSSIGTKSSMSRRTIGGKSYQQSPVKREPSKAELLAMIGGKGKQTSDYQEIKPQPE